MLSNELKQKCARPCNAGIICVTGKTHPLYALPPVTHVLYALTPVTHVLYALQAFWPTWRHADVIWWRQYWPICWPDPTQNFDPTRNPETDPARGPHAPGPVAAGPWLCQFRFACVNFFIRFFFFAQPLLFSINIYINKLFIKTNLNIFKKS